MSEVKITRQRLQELEDREEKLRCLEAGGVNDWEWYGESLKDYYKKKELEEKVDTYVEEISEALHGNIEEPAGRGCGFGIRGEGLEQIKSILLRVIKESLNQ